MLLRDEGKSFRVTTLIRPFLAKRTSPGAGGNDRRYRIAFTGEPVAS